MGGLCHLHVKPGHFLRALRSERRLLCSEGRASPTRKGTGDGEEHIRHPQKGDGEERIRHPQNIYQGGQSVDPYPAVRILSLVVKMNQLEGDISA